MRKNLMGLPIILVILGSIALSGCDTSDPAGKDVSDLGQYEGEKFELAINGEWGYQTPVDIKEIGLASYALEEGSSIYFSFHFIANQDIPGGLKMTLVNRKITKEQYDAHEAGEADAPEPEWETMAENIIIQSGDIVKEQWYRKGPIEIAIPAGKGSTADEFVQLAIYAGSESVGKIAEPLLLKQTKLTLSNTGVEYGAPQVITVKTDIDGGDPAAGKGNIEGEEFAKLASAPPDSVLRLSITADSISDSGPAPGWGIGKIGPDATAVEFAVPSNVSNGSNVSFTVDVSVADLLDAAGDNTLLFVNIWADCKITKIELLSPSAAE
ncbi:MAG: hypothetical protein LBH85_08690 [Treponema sp.]|jgi:predicted small secreted protein|nr:hypothetical protein [Treponema sp.]